LNSVFGLCCYTSNTGQAEVIIWNMVHGLSPNHRNGKRHTVWTFRPCHKKHGTCHTTKRGSPTFVLINHFAAEIMLTAILNQGCKRPSLGLECHLTASTAKCTRWIYALPRHINGGGTNTCTSETITHSALASNWHNTVSHMHMTCVRHMRMTCDCLLVTCPDYFLQASSDSHM
jgi:hypothetical protein